MNISETFIRTDKLKNPRGRITGYRANLLDQSGSVITSEDAPTAVEAQANLFQTIQRGMKALCQNPTLLRWRGHVALVYPTFGGYWAYGFIPDDKTSPASSSGCIDNKKEALRQARRHLADKGWIRGETECPFIEDAEDRQAFTKYWTFQNRACDLMDMGFTWDEALQLLDGSARYHMTPERFASLKDRELPEYVKL